MIIGGIDRAESMRMQKKISREKTQLARQTKVKEQAQQSAMSFPNDSSGAEDRDNAKNIKVEYPPGPSKKMKYALTKPADEGRNSILL